MTSTSSDPGLRSRLGKLVAMLSSPEDLEAATALRKLADVLQSHGLSFVDLAEMITGLHYAEPEEVPDDEADPGAFDPWSWDLPGAAEEWVILIRALIDAKAWRDSREDGFLHRVLDWALGDRLPSSDQRRWILDIRARWRDRARGP